jgi:hypothetical protein
MVTWFEFARKMEVCRSVGSFITRARCGGIARNSYRDENTGVARIREVGLLCFAPLQDEKNGQ